MLYRESLSRETGSPVSPFAPRISIREIYSGISGEITALCVYMYTALRSAVSDL